MPGVHDSQTTLCRGDDEETEVERIERKKRMKEFTKKSAKYVFTQIGLVVLVSLYVFTQIGLVVLVSLYAVAGGFIFSHLEQTNEMSECVQGQTQYNEMQNSTTYKMWAIAGSFQSKDDKQYAMVEFRKQLVSFRDNIIALGYDGTNCSLKDTDVGYKWSFMGSLLFSTTVFTTVGYGNIAPRTFWGRLVCIAYAVLGIPLMLLCLANIGEIMANVFRYVYFNVFCCGCNCFRRRVVKTRPKSTKPTPGGTGESETDAWKNRYNNQSDSNRATEDIAVVDDDADNDDDEDEDEEENKLSVPLTITIGMLAIYVFMGAMLFSVWNPSWDWLIGAYFCFVTISTIGFGDFVPGYSNNAMDLAAQLQMVVAAVYMVFGMALMSMAFNLIQEEMVGKFKWVGEKMGIVKNDEDDDEIEEEENSRPPAVPAAPMRAGPGPDHNKLTPPGGGGPPRAFYMPHNKSQ